MPNLRLPSWLQNITDCWPVPNYTCLETGAQGGELLMLCNRSPVGSWTCVLLIATSTSTRYATLPPFVEMVLYNHFNFWLIYLLIWFIDCVTFNSLRFDVAFDLMKRHRINMNLMYDHNPAAFHSNTETFVRQLDVPANINLFLTDLRLDHETLNTLYHLLPACDFWFKHAWPWACY